LYGHNWIVAFHECEEWVEELVTSVRNKRTFYQRGYSIIANGGYSFEDGFYIGASIYNNGSTINTGDGNDSIIANGGFLSDSDNSGSVFLGDGEDYIKNFGSGNFYGGNGNDTRINARILCRWDMDEGGESTIFTNDNQLMITSEFEKLKAGNTIYDFTSLTTGQVITVT
jgi:hypothetical protein